MLGVCFFSGIAFAQIPGPVPLTGAGGAESTFTPPLVGTGGTISTFNTYTIHAFTASGTFVPPDAVTQIDVLVVVVRAALSGRPGLLYSRVSPLRWVLPVQTEPV
jgi:hypothetical protein